MLSHTFSNKLNTISGELGMNPRDLLLVMYLESGVDPSSVNTTYSKNPQRQARGLIQFMPSTLKGMGLSNNDIANFTQKPAEDQLDYVKQYVQAHRNLIGGKSFTSATQYYIANLYPKALLRWQGDDPTQNASVVVLDSRSSDPRERDAYTANMMLDHNRDGKITVSDITNTLMGLEKTGKFQNMLAQFNSVAGEGSVSDKSLIGSNKNSLETSVSPEVARFLNEINSFMNHITANDRSVKVSKYGENYPINKFLILINDGNIESNIEYARVLSSALKEELGAQTNIFSNGINVNIECNVAAKKIDGFRAVNELCQALSTTFAHATRKIGSVYISTSVYPDMVSKYSAIDINMAELNYRKFQLRFLKGKRYE